MPDLSQSEREILSCLSEDGGFTTGQVSRLAFISYGMTNRRARGHAIRGWLLEMKSRGLVEFLDDQKPVCWKRTPAGSAAWLSAERKANEYEAMHCHSLNR